MFFQIAHYNLTLYNFILNLKILTQINLKNIFRAQIKETDEPLKEESNTISKPEESQKEHNKCRSEHPPSNQGLGHGCELIITILCDLHCTSETQKSKGYTSGLCKPFDPVCYCKC